MLDVKHTFNFSHATLIKPMHCKKLSSKHIKQAGTYHISPNLADIILGNNNIEIENR